MKSFLGLLFAICVVPAWAGQAPVSQAEASAVFRKAEQAMKSVLRYRSNPSAFPAGTAVATREQILKHLTELYGILQPTFKFTPPPAKSAPAYISFKDAKAKQLTEKLETLGFVDRYGPLATSKSPGLTLEEFGDVVGYFLARVADLTHTPSTKFSPYLMPG